MGSKLEVVLHMYFTFQITVIIESIIDIQKMQKKKLCLDFGVDFMDG